MPRGVIAARLLEIMQATAGMSDKEDVEVFC